MEKSFKFVFVTTNGPGGSTFDRLAVLLSPVQSVRLAVERRPLLGWDDASEDAAAARLRRLDRIAEVDPAETFVEAATFYLPYAPALLRQCENAILVHLSVPVDEVVDRFVSELETRFLLPTHHWLQPLQEPWTHDFDWSRTFPKSDQPDRAAAIRTYAAEYEQAVTLLAEEFPGRVQIIAADSITTESGRATIAEMVGVEFADLADVEDDAMEPAIKPHSRSAVRESALNDPRRCAILVPAMTHIEPACDESLRTLERRGYPVIRVFGISAIDQARNRMASRVLIDGYEETLWIDSDIGFEPDAVERLRSHGVPIASGIYAKKGSPAFATSFLPAEGPITMGEGGDLRTVRYAATGFLHVRREVYQRMHDQLGMVACNELFEPHPTYGFFQPLIIERDESFVYMGEDYSFCHRAVECGFTIQADTSVRLWHIGKHKYSWEDVVRPRERTESTQFRLVAKVGQRPGIIKRDADSVVNENDAESTDEA